MIVEIYPLTLPESVTNSWNDNLSPSFFKEYIEEKSSPATMLPSFEMETYYAEKQAAFASYLKFGGYPALTNDTFSKEDKKEWLRMYVKTFLERDIRDLASFRDLEAFIKRQRYLAQTT